MLLGHRADIADLLHMSDIFVFPSFQEGLPVALMEAMAAGMPCVASDIRGNVDLIEHGKGGLLCEAGYVKGFQNAISRLINDFELRHKMGQCNKSAVRKYDISVVLAQITEW